MFLLNFTEKLGNVKVEVPEVTQSEIGQKQKLREVLDMVNRLLQPPLAFNNMEWTKMECGQWVLLNNHVNPLVPEFLQF